MDKATKQGMVIILIIFLILFFSLLAKHIPGLDLSRYKAIFGEPEFAEPDREYFGSDIDMGGSAESDIHDMLYNDKSLLERSYDIHEGPQEMYPEPNYGD